MDIDEEDGKSGTREQEGDRARIKRACKFLRAYYKNKALEDKDDVQRRSLRANMSSRRSRTRRSRRRSKCVRFGTRCATRKPSEGIRRVRPGLTCVPSIRSPGGLFARALPTDVKIVDKLMLRLANQLEEDAEEMVEALIQYNTKMEGVRLVR